MPKKRLSKLSLRARRRCIQGYVYPWHDNLPN